MTDLSIGHLRSRVSLERAAGIPDGAGGETISWLPRAELWARIVPSSGHERFEAHGSKSTVRFDIFVRPHPDIVAACRFRLGQRLFHIRAVRVLGTSRPRLVCQCDEINL
jgi:SPP1 family predicted phage head-tail adaptor